MAMRAILVAVAVFQTVALLFLAPKAWGGRGGGGGGVFIADTGFVNAAFRVEQLRAGDSCWWPHAHMSAKCRAAFEAHLRDLSPLHVLVAVQTPSDKKLEQFLSTATARLLALARTPVEVVFCSTDHAADTRGGRPRISSLKASGVSWPVLEFWGNASGRLAGLTAKLTNFWRFATSPEGSARYAKRRWVLKLDTDTVVVAPLLAELLASEDASVPKYLGYVIPSEFRFATGSGYLLSMPALRILGQQIRSTNVTPFEFEDVWFGWLLNEGGVPVENNTWGFFNSKPSARLATIESGLPCLTVHELKTENVAEFDALALLLATAPQYNITKQNLPSFF